MVSKHLTKRRQEFIICLLLIAATSMVYWPITACDFINNYDDGSYITENRQVESGFTYESIIWAFTTGHSANWHPLTWLSHMLDVELYGLNPMGHHWTNLQLHIANTILLFLVLRMMTGALWKSAFVAALFAIHPLHVQSVAWISERKDVLSTLFWILSLWAYIYYVRFPNKFRYSILILFFALGLMSKPMLVTLPFALLLLDFWPLNRLQPGHKNLLPLIKEKIPLFILSTISSLITFFVQQQGGAVKSLEKFSLETRIANVFLSYLGYIKKMIWPQDLAIFYPYPETIPLAKAIVSALLLFTFTALVTRAARKFPYLLTGWFWYLGTLVPVIGIIQVGSQSMADRYTYIPLIGLFVMITWGISDISAKWRSRKTVLALSAAGVLIPLMVCTWLQIGHWQNSMTLFTRALNVTNRNSVAYYTLGLTLQQEGKLDKAITYYSKALEINPYYPEARNNLGAVLLSQGNIEAAIYHFRELLRLNPDNAGARNNLAAILAGQGKAEEAISHLEEALRIEPENAGAHYNLANLLYAQEKIDKAILHYTESLRIEPENADAHYNLGRILIKQGKIKEAMRHFAEAIKVNPDFAEVYNEAGIILAEQGQLKNAQTFFAKAIQIRPNFAEARKNLEILLDFQSSSVSHPVSTTEDNVTTTN